MNEVPSVKAQLLQLSNSNYLADFPIFAFFFGNYTVSYAKYFQSFRVTKLEVK